MEYQEVEFLDGEFDEDYEPTAEEIHDYARFLGMDPIADKDLLYIARDGLKAPLPDPWRACRQDDDEICYYNPITKEYRADHPMDDFFRKKYQKEKALKAHQKKQNTGSSNFKSKLTEKIHGNTNAAEPEKKSASNTNMNNNDPKKELKSIQKSKNLMPLNKANDGKNKSISLEGSFDVNGSFLTDNQNNSNNLGKKEANNLSRSEDQPPPIIIKKGKKESENILESSYEYDEGNKMQSKNDNRQPEYDQIDNETTKKCLAYEETKKKELEELKNDFNKKLIKTEEELMQKMKNDLETLKMTLNSSKQGAKTESLKDKEAIKNKLSDDYDKAYQKEANNLKEDHAQLLKETETTQETKLENELQDYEKKLKNDYESKKLELNKQKKDMQNQIEKYKIDEENSKNMAVSKFEKEKDKLVKDYSSQLDDFENKQLSKQKEELENYNKESEIKYAKEEKEVMEAYKHKIFLDSSMLDEIKITYDKKFEAEKEKIDMQIIKIIKDYEETLKIKKDTELTKYQLEQLKFEKEKKLLHLQNEREQLKQNFTKRLDDYRQALALKTQFQKNGINKDFERMLEQYKANLKNIKIDINSEDDIANQMKILQNDETNTKTFIENIENMLQTQKIENKQYQEKLYTLKKENPYMQDIYIPEVNSEPLDDVKSRINTLGVKITSLEKGENISIHNNRAERDKERGKSTEKLLLKNTSVSATIAQGSNNNSVLLSKLMQEITDIKSFMTKQDKEHETIISGANVPKKHNTIKTKSHNEHYNHNKRDSTESNEELLTIQTQRKWKDIYNEEKAKIKKLRDEIEMNKQKNKKFQDYLIEQQKKFREQYQFYKQNPDQGQKRKRIKALKKTLNDEVKKLNDEIYILRENEFILKSKERALKHLGKIIKEMDNNQINIRDIEIIYQNYKDLDSRYKSQPNLHEIKSSDDNDTDKDHANNIYEKWKGILDNQLGLDQAMDSTSENDHEQNQKLKSLDLDNIVPDSTIDHNEHQQRQNQSNQGDSQNAASANTTNDNMLKMLDYRIRSKIKYPNETIMQKEINKVTENRHKIKSIFQDHAQWLTTLKNQLNFHIYNKPYSLMSNFGTLEKY